jgi:hypothetical protein
LSAITPYAEHLHINTGREHAVKIAVRFAGEILIKTIALLKTSADDIIVRIAKDRIKMKFSIILCISIDQKNKARH